MVQKTFGIYSDENTSSHLYVELGTKHIVCWTTNSEGSAAAFELFQADNETKTHLKETFRAAKLHSKLLESNYDKVFVVLDNECCLLLPEIELNESAQSDLLHLAFGESKNSDYKIGGDSLKFLYPIHKRLSELLQKEFPSAEILHKYQCLNHRKSGAYPHHILLTCYPEHCIVSVKNEDEYLLLQRFNYETPEDVVYFILNICKQLKLELSETTVSVQGLIDSDSELFAELHKYIPELELAQPAGDTFASASFSEYPAHYFSSFIKQEA